MIKNKLTAFLSIVYFLTLSNLAFARVIRVSECTIPFDFTLGSICVLGTLGLWIIIPLVLALIFSGFGIIVQIIKHIFSR
ncbi:hypothetical protein N9T18_00235 [Candidatus Pelagibacter sp.]|nr:hypothetical protein [Candidatus Pelagibacter sp.]|tara:strand:- start:129 stop:368 length:240 start_codon:yes stop_codon:yes gene_type:complete